VSLADLKVAAFACTPEDLRGSLWKLLLAYYPERRNERQAHVQQRRREYFDVYLPATELGSGRHRSSAAAEAEAVAGAGARPPTPLGGGGSGGGGGAARRVSAGGARPAARARPRARAERQRCRGTRAGFRF